MELCACTMQNEKVKIEKEGISHERSGACESYSHLLHHCILCIVCVVRCLMLHFLVVLCCSVLRVSI